MTVGIVGMIVVMLTCDPLRGKLWAVALVVGLLMIGTGTLMAVTP